MRGVQHVRIMLRTILITYMYFPMTIKQMYLCNVCLKIKVLIILGQIYLIICKLTGLRIVNGRVGQDRGIGKCTYVGSMGKKFGRLCLSKSVFISGNMHIQS